MGKGKINSLFDREALKKELSDVQGDIDSLLSNLKTAIGGLADTKVSIGSANNFKELNTAQQQYNSYVKQSENFIKQLADSEAKLVIVRQKESEVLTQNKLKLRELNKEQSDRIRLRNAEEGSIEQLSLKYDKAYRIFKQLSEAQRESARGQALQQFLTDTNAKLKELEGNVGNFRRNVGNYAGSLAKPFETLINKVEELKANLKQGIGIGGNDVAALQRAGTAITIIETALEKSSAAGTTSVKQVRNLSNAYQDLSVTIGKADATTFLSSLGVEVGEAKDEVQDLKDELKLNASDTKGIDNVTGSLNALAGVAQGAAGAYALFGANEEDAAKVTAKLIAVQGIANSVQSVGTELSRKGTTANKAFVFVQELVATATNATATATARLNAVLKLSTIGLVVAAIGGFIYLLSKANDITSTFGKNMQSLNEINKSASQTYADQAVKLKLLVSEYENEGTSIKRKKEIQKELNALAPAYFDNLKSEAAFHKDIAKQADKASKALLIQAKIQAAQGLLSQRFKDLLDKQFDPSKAITFGDKVSSSFRNLGSLLKTISSGSGSVQLPSVADFKDLGERAQKNISKAEDEYDSFEKFIQKFVADSNKELALLGGPTGGTTDDKAKENDNKSKKLADSTAQDILKSNLELAKIQIQREQEKARSIFENETKSYAERISALRNFNASQLQLIEVERQFEIESEKINLKAKLDGLEEEKKAIQKNKDLSKTDKASQTKAINEQEEKEIEASNKRIEVIYARSSKNITDAVKAFNNDLKTLKDARETLRKEEEKDLQDYEEFTMGWLNDFRKKQADANKKWDDDDKARSDKAKEDQKNAQRQLYQELLSTISFFFTASIDNETAALETKKRLQEEDLARRINQINQLGLSEEERIKQTAQAQKQADFEKLEIEKRQRKLAVEKAKFEKLANIASIISSTAQAVISALGQRPWTPANIALAGLVGSIGALQLAKAIATPLPQYKTGTDSAKKGLAMVSEEGEELMERNGRFYLTPAQPTLMEMVGGEKITPADRTLDILNAVSLNKMVANGGMTVLKASGMSERQADKMIEELRDLKKETARSKTNLTLISDNGWNVYVQKNIR